MMQPNIKSRLSTMMFLQYAVWGAWLPLAARYLAADPSQGGLGFTGAQIGMILGLAGSVGAAVAPIPRRASGRSVFPHGALSCRALVHWRHHHMVYSLSEELFRMVDSFYTL